MNTPKVGDRIDHRYELRRQLGESDACTLFEAVHRYTGRRVVMKLLRGGDGTADDTEALVLRDAFALGRIRHPYLVELLDAGVAECGPYVVTALVEGRSLEGLLATRGAFSPEETATVGRQIALGLEALHRNGLLHGDVSPANVWIVRSPLGEEQVILRNLQLTYEPRPPGARDPLRGRTGPFEPRARDGHGSRAVDPRGDLYQLGLLMFECLLGRPPEGTPGDPEAPSLRSLRPELPGALSFAIERCLKPAGDERFSCARDLVGILETTQIARGSTRFLSTKSQQGLRAVTPVLDRPARRSAPLPVAAPDPAMTPGGTAGESPSWVSRRKVARAAYATPVRLIGHHGVMEGRIEDISTRGVLVIAAKPLENGVVVQLSFALPGNGVMIQTNAVLRWVRLASASQRAALGFEFQVPPLALRNAVDAYVIQREGGNDTDEGNPRQ
jgi:hypothetical protein